MKKKKGASFFNRGHLNDRAMNGFFLSRFFFLSLHWQIELLLSWLSYNYEDVFLFFYLKEGMKESRDARASLTNSKPSAATGSFAVDKRLTWEENNEEKKKRIWIGWLVYDCHYSRVCGVGEINKTQVASKQEMTLELDGCFKATTRISFFHNFNINLLRSAI